MENRREEYLQRREDTQEQVNIIPVNLYEGQ